MLVFFTGYSDYHQRTLLDWSEAEKNTFVLAMNSYSDVSNLTFNVINNPSESVSVDNNIDILWYTMAFMIWSTSITTPVDMT